MRDVCVDAYLSCFYGLKNAKLLWIIQAWSDSGGCLHIRNFWSWYLSLPKMERFWTVLTIFTLFCVSRHLNHPLCENHLDIYLILLLAFTVLWIVWNLNNFIWLQVLRNSYDSGLLRCMFVVQAILLRWKLIRMEARGLFENYLTQRFQCFLSLPNFLIMVRILVTGGHPECEERCHQGMWKTWKGHCCFFY